MASTETLYLGIDCSTTATKAIAWTADGTAVAEGRAALPLARPGPGLYEQHPDQWWEALCAAIRAALEGCDPSCVVALAIANQRETVAPLDSDMRPVRPAMLWLDERGRDQVGRVAETLGAAYVHDATGKPVELCPALYRILWMRDEERALFERTARVVDVQAYLNWCLTGHVVTSWASGDPFGVLDMRRFQWHGALIERLGLAARLFVPLVAPGTPLGTLTPEASTACGLPSGTIVVAGGGDGQAAGLGARVLAPGRAYCNLGTAIVAGVHADRYQADLAFRTLTSCVPGAYICEALLRTGTSLVSWFVEHFGPDAATCGDASAEAVLEARAAHVPAGSEGLVLLPHWHAAGTPHWDVLARGAVIGWTPAHGAAHFYRAVLEGLAMELCLTIDGIARATGEPIHDLVLTGGGSRSSLWRQIVADVTGRTIVDVASTELTSLGAGMLAATGAGRFASVAVAAQAMGQDRATLTPDPGRHAVYVNVFERAYRPLYAALREITHAISALAVERGRG